MQFKATTIPGTYEVLLQRLEDERGYFARTWCAREFAAQGLPDVCVQASVSHNAERGTLRGLHFQWPPSREGKLVRCEQGAVYDVALDLRPDSPTFLEHLAVTLEAARGNALYIPAGVAHGFQALEDDTRVLYFMSDFYAPELADGVRFDDPAFGIDWPLPVSQIAPRDRDCPDFDRAAHVERVHAGPGWGSA
jgi:dTDP-4-dehydrorhamnose 3,5-epimerase